MLLLVEKLLNEYFWVHMSGSGSWVTHRPKPITLIQNVWLNFLKNLLVLSGSALYLLKMNPNMGHFCVETLILTSIISLGDLVF